MVRLDQPGPAGRRPGRVRGPARAAHRVLPRRRAVRSAKRVLDQLTMPGADAIRADARRFQQLVASDAGQGPHGRPCSGRACRPVGRLNSTSATASEPFNRETDLVICALLTARWRKQSRVRRIRSGPCFCPPSHYVIILAISRQCPVVASVQMPLTVSTANAHHHERELLHTRCLCTPTVAYAVPSRKRLRTSVGLSRFPDGARAGFIRYSLAPLNCWPGDSAGNTRPRGRRTARG